MGQQQYESIRAAIKDIITMIKTDQKTPEDHVSNLGYFKQIQLYLKNSLRPYNEDSDIRDFLNMTYQLNPLVPKEITGTVISPGKIDSRAFIE